MANWSVGLMQEHQGSSGLLVRVGMESKPQRRWAKHAALFYLANPCHQRSLSLVCPLNACRPSGCAAEKKRCPLNECFPDSRSSVNCGTVVYIWSLESMKLV